jgi:hypothetical protein
MPDGQMMNDGKPPDDVKTPEIIEAECFPGLG